MPAAISPKLVLVGHSNAITSLAFSADGNTLLSGSYDQAIIVWDVASGEMKRRFLTGDFVETVALSPDASSIVSSNGQVWDVATGNLRHRYRGMNAPIALSPDGATLAFATLNQGKEWIVRLTNLRTGRTESTFPCGEIYPEALAFSADGKLVGIGGALEEHSWIWAANLWDRQNKRLYTTEFKKRMYLKGVFLGRWTRLVAFNQEAIRDTETGDLLQIWPPTESDFYVQTMALSNDGRLLASAYDSGVVMIRNVTTREIVHRIQAHEGWVRALAFTADNRTLATAGNDKVIHLWNVEEGTLTAGRRKCTFPGRRGEVWRLAFDTQQSLLLAEGDDGRVRYWNLGSGAMQQTLPGYLDDEGGRVELTQEDRQNVLHGRRQRRERNVRTLGDGENRLTARLYQKERECGIVLQRGQWSCDIKILTGEQEDFLKRDDILDFALSSDGKTLATGHYVAGGVKLWDVESGTLIRTIAVMDDPLALAFSQDGKTLAIGTAYDEFVLLVPVNSHARGHRLTGHTNLRCWPPASLRKTGGIIWLKQHTDSVRCLAYSPDGKWLASGAADNTINLWSAKTNHLVLTLLALPEDDWIAYTPEGYYHASPGAASYLRWQVGNDLLPAEAYAIRFWQPQKIQEALTG